MDKQADRPAEKRKLSAAELKAAEDNKASLKIQFHSGDYDENNLQHPRISPLIYVVIASAIASIGGILFGYDIGIISGALLLLKKQFGLSSFEQEMVVSAVLIGSLCCSFFGGNIVDRFGRKRAIIVSGILFILAALLLAFSVNYPMLIVGRFIVGLAVSMSVTAECTYISEISPPNRRGMLVSLNEVGITVGFLIAYLLNYVFISSPQGWKYMFAFAVIPALLQIVGISFMPQSPHFLLIKGKQEEAKRSLLLLRQRINVDDEIRAIQKTLQDTIGTKCTDLLSSSNNLRSRLLLGMALVFFQQVSGNANVLYYAPIVFQHFGYCSDSSATLVTVGLGIIKVISTTVTVLTVDKLGRSKFLMAGCSLMGVSLIILGTTAIVTIDPTTTDYCSDEMMLNDSSRSPDDEFMKNYFNHSSFHNESERLQYSYNGSHVQWDNFTLDIPSNVPTMSLANRIISVISLMVFVCAYGISYGPVTWLILSEIFPTGLRGRAMSVATCINWGANILISMTFLNLMDSIGIGYTFIMYGLISIIALTFVIICVPETKNKSLEQINSELNNGFVKISSLKHVLSYCQCYR